MTPYTTALRLVVREVENTSRTLAAIDARVAQLDARVQHIAHDLASERATVSEHYIIPVHAFHSRRREERERLNAQRLEALADADVTRHRLAQLQARQQGLETAAEQWRRDEQKRLEKREQAAADDRSATRIVAAARQTRIAIRRRAVVEGMQ